jgi:hypothetical protein
VIGIVGIFFYWIGWIGWTAFTFLMKKSKERIFLSYLLLVCLSVSDVHLKFLYFKVNVALLILVFISCFYISKQKLLEKIHALLLVTIVMMGIVAFMLLSLSDPGWFMVDTRFLLSVLLSLTLYVLSNSIKLRISSIILGAFLGEFIFSLTIINLNSELVIGSFFTLDLISLTLIYFISFYHLSKLRQSFSQKVNIEKKGRALNE